MINKGGRMTSDRQPDGTVRITISGGKNAKRLDAYRAYLICGWCYADLYIKRTDNQPLSDLDMAEALDMWNHFCGETA